jgi:deoxycytidylate deaminase
VKVVNQSVLEYVVTHAKMEALKSPCAKSKRGVVIFDISSGKIVGRGHNRPPRPWECDGSDRCVIVASASGNGKGK